MNEEDAKVLKELSDWFLYKNPTSPFAQWSDWAIGLLLSGLVERNK